MKNFKSVYSLTCLVFILILSGCASVKVIDKVSSGTPKGYVEFYYVQGEGDDAFRYSVYRIANDKEFYEGQTPLWDVKKGNIGLRLAKSTGDYTFSVRASTISRTFPVHIEEGKIIRVKIVFTNLYDSMSEQGKSLPMSAYLKINVYPESPVPISEDKR